MSNRAEEKGNDDGEGLDELLPSAPDSNTSQMLADSNISRARVTDSRASGFIDLVQPSTSADINIPDLPISSKNTKNSTKYDPNFEISNSFDQEPSTSGMSHGVKRKFCGDHFQTHRRKRQKMYNCKNTRQTKFKRKNTSDHSGTDSKRFKIEHAHSTGSHLDSESTASCSGSTYPSGENSAFINDNEEESEDVQPCPRSCVCQAGPSQLLLPVERKFDTPAPLYKACLLRRIYSLPNTQYMCCKKRCVTKFSRERVMKVCLFHMEEDYYKSDLSVHQYKWGEWKD